MKGIGFWVFDKFGPFWVLLRTKQLVLKTSMSLSHKVELFFLGKNAPSLSYDFEYFIA